MLSLKNYIARQNTKSFFEIEKIGAQVNQLRNEIKNIASDTAAPAIERATSIIEKNKYLNLLEERLSSETEKENKLQQLKEIVIESSDSILNSMPELRYLSTDEIRKFVIVDTNESGQRYVIRRSDVIKIIVEKLNSLMNSTLELIAINGESQDIHINSLEESVALIQAFEKIKEFLVEIGNDNDELLDANEVCETLYQPSDIEIGLINNVYNKDIGNELTTLTPGKLRNLFGIKGNTLYKTINSIPDEQKPLYYVVEMKKNTQYRYLTIRGIALVLSIVPTKRYQEALNIIESIDPEVALKVRSFLNPDINNQEKEMELQFEKVWDNIGDKLRNDSIVMIFENDRVDWTYVTFVSIVRELLRTNNIALPKDYVNQVEDRLLTHKGNFINRISQILSKLNLDPNIVTINQLLSQKVLPSSKYFATLEEISRLGFSDIKISEILNIINRFSHQIAEVPKLQNPRLRELNEVSSYDGNAWLRTIISSAKNIERMESYVELAQEKEKYSIMMLLFTYNITPDLYDIENTEQEITFKDWLLKDVVISTGKLLTYLTDEVRSEILSILDIIQSIIEDQTLSLDELRGFIYDSNSFNNRKNMKAYIFLLILALECKTNNKDCNFIHEIKDMVEKYRPSNYKTEA